MTFIESFSAKNLCAKMSKTTNKQQIELLLNSMQTRPDIARGFFKGSKEELTRFWRQVEQKLNSAGPPLKNVTEWKKVWADQKKYVRQKAGHNLKASKATGGSPNQEQKFSATENQIYDLIGMKESVEGVENTFGLGSLIQTAPENLILTLEDDVIADLVDQNDEVTFYQPRAKKREQETKTPSKTHSSTAILEEELSIQKEMVETMKEQLQATKKIYQYIDRLHDIIKQHLQESDEAMKRTKRSAII